MLQSIKENTINKKISGIYGLIILKFLEKNWQDYHKYQRKEMQISFNVKSKKTEISLKNFLKKYKFVFCGNKCQEKIDLIAPLKLEYFKKETIYELVIKLGFSVKPLLIKTS